MAKTGRPKSPISTQDRARLIKLLGMTTSSFDNEALSACRMANALLKSLDRQWSDVVGGFVEVQAAQPRKPPGKPSIFERIADILDDSADCLTNWEFDFLNNVLDTRYCSPKQLVIVRRIFEKVERAYT